MLTDFFYYKLSSSLTCYTPKNFGGIGYHISIFLIFIELAKISSFVQQSTRLKGLSAKKCNKHLPQSEQKKCTPHKYTL